MENKEIINSNNNENKNINNKDEEKEMKEVNENNKSTNKKEEENKNPEENKIKDKINSVPEMMRCFLCEDFCDDPVMSLCCNEIFCKKHITEEILKNFKCPNCNQRCMLNSIIENKKLAEDIKWFKKLLNELVIGENDKIHN